MARKTKTRKTQQVFYIIGEGETEKNYFDEIKRHENLNILIKPQLPQNSSFQGIIKKAEKLPVAENDKIFCLFDIDKIIEDKKETDFQKIKKDTKSDKMHFIETNPCFELWFLLHFKYSAKKYKTCKELINELKKITELTNYKKTSAIYEKLKNNLNKAKENAKKLETSENDFNRTRCQVFKIIQELGL